jgi:hypothetical protein
VKPGWHYHEAQKALKHASAATTGTYEEDMYLRLAQVHATLAGVPAEVSESTEAMGLPGTLAGSTECA